MARADLARHGHRRDPDWTGTGDKHILSDRIKGERRVHGIPGRVEHRVDFIVDRIGKGNIIEGRQAQIFRKNPCSLTPTTRVVGSLCNAPPASRRMSWTSSRPA